MKVNKSQLVEALSTKTDMPKASTERFLDALVEEITSQLQSGNDVALTGFGTFKTSDRKAREGVNPKTGEKIQIPAMTVPKFSAGKALKEAVR